MEIHTHASSHLIAWLKLCFTPKLGIRTLQKLISHDSAENLVQSSKQSLCHLGLTENQTHFIHHQSTALIEQCLSWLTHEHHYILTPQDTCYPFLLSQITRPPNVLFIQGNHHLLSQPQIAIVGSRHASHHGLLAASEFSQYLSRDGFCITSGLALGVDGHAHQAALEVKGKTLAVLGSGLNQVYPAKHRDLAHRILENQGALISEFPPHTQPKATNFPRRNRIISGLSLGVLVIEAAQRSGSLITARYALEQNRDVFALPYSIYHAGGSGNNMLLNDGAMLALNPELVANNLHASWQNLQLAADQSNASKLFNPPSSLLDSKPPSSLQPSEIETSEIETSEIKEIGNRQPSSQQKQTQPIPFPKLFNQIRSEPIPIDILAQKTHIPVHEVMLQILELELAGFVMSVPGGYIRV